MENGLDKRQIYIRVYKDIDINGKSLCVFLNNQLSQIEVSNQISVNNRNQMKFDIFIGFLQLLIPLPSLKRVQMNSDSWSWFDGYFQST